MFKRLVIWILPYTLFSLTAFGMTAFEKAMESGNVFAISASCENFPSLKDKVKAGTDAGQTSFCFLMEDPRDASHNIGWVNSDLNTILSMASLRIQSQDYNPDHTHQKMIEDWAKEEPNRVEEVLRLPDAEQQAIFQEVVIKKRLQLFPAHELFSLSPGELSSFQIFLKENPQNIYYFGQANGEFVIIQKNSAMVTPQDFPEVTAQSISKAMERLVPTIAIKREVERSLPEDSPNRELLEKLMMNCEPKKIEEFKKSMIKKLNIQIPGEKKSADWDSCSMN